jgi:hypothetical protein
MVSDEMSEARKRLVCFLREFESTISDIARRGYEESGPGSIFICEPKKHGYSLGPTIVYLPSSAPEFHRMGPLAHDLLRDYNPRNEYVMVFVTREDEVYVVLNELVPAISMN